MVATTLADDRPSLWDTASGDLVLRVCNSSRRGQVVRLKSAKCTIGSGPRCTLRLRARGVSPLHCLIVRGSTKAVVRCWSPDTRLNQESFSDAALSRGDRLAIGPVELEVVSVGSCHTTAALPPIIETPADVPPKADPAIELQRQSLEEERRRLDELTVSLQGREASLQTQTEETIAQRHDLDTQRQALQQQSEQGLAEQAEARNRLNAQQEQIDVQLADLKAERDALADEHRLWESQRAEATVRAAVQTEQMDARSTEAEAANLAMQQQREQWLAEQAEAKNRLDAQREQLNSQLADLKAEREALAEERRLWAAQQSEAASQATAQAEQFQTQMAEWQAERQAFEQQKQQWQTEQAETQRQLDTQRDDMAARLADLESQRAALTEERQQLEIQRVELQAMPALPVALSESAVEAEPSSAAPVEELQFQAPPEAAPVDLAAVFRRIGAKVEQEEEPTAREPIAPMERPLDTARQRESAATPAQDEGDEESIDDYMSRLMSRIRSTSGDAAPATSTKQASGPTRAPRETVTTDIAAEKQPASPAATTLSGHEDKPGEMTPHAVAPEKRTDLSALRELANLSAQSAISHYCRQVLIHTMYSKLLVAAVALVAGGALLWMWKDFGALQMTFYSSLVALLVAIYWGVEYALLTGRLIISKSGHIDIGWNSSRHGKHAAPTDEVAVQQTSAEDVASPPHD